MAKAIRVRLCGGCGAEIPDPVPEKCIVCSRTLEPPKNAHFDPPVYLKHQLQEYITALNIDVVGKAPSAEQKKEFDEVIKSLESWYRKAPASDKFACLQESLNFVRNLLFTDHTPEEMSALCQLGQMIGKQAEVIQNYFKVGGAYYEPKSEPVSPDTGSVGGDKEATD